MRIRLLVLIAGLLLCVPSAALADGGPIMPLSSVQPGMSCTGETVIQGTTISSFGVNVIDVVQDPQEGPRILVSVSGATVAPSGVAEGFSGSPVYCPDPNTGVLENVGAISESIGQFGNDVVLVTPIQLMLGEPVRPPVDAPRLAARGRPLLSPLTVGGLSGGWVNLLERAAKRAGRQLAAAPGSGTPSFPVQQLVPGASVAASYASGAVPVGAIGTVTYRDGNDVYAFGHELDGAGRRSLLLQDAYVYDIVDNPSAGEDSSYKLASPRHTVGTLTSDTPDAVIGEVGAPPATIPVTATAHDEDTGHTLALRSQVADETDIGTPLGVSLLSVVAPLVVGQAATEIYDGPPANESGKMCVRVTIRESRAPLRFCNRYVGSGVPGDSGDEPPELALTTASDLENGLGLIDSVQFAALHVTGVTARIDAQRGLAEGTIVAARAPLHVSAGQRVPVQILVRVYRGPLRQFSFRVRIPRGAKGTIAAKIGNASENPGSGSLGQQLAQELAAALEGGGGFGGGPPATIQQLHREFAATSVYDGLQVRFKKHPAVNVYRNPSLLITGVAELVFKVRS